MKHPDCFIGYLMFLVSLVERSSVSAFPPQNIPQERLTMSHNTINVYGIYLSTHQFLLRHNFVNGTGKPVSEVLSEFFGNGKQTWLSVFLFFSYMSWFKKKCIPLNTWKIVFLTENLKCEYFAMRISFQNVILYDSFP